MRAHNSIDRRGFILGLWGMALCLPLRNAFAQQPQDSPECFLGLVTDVQYCDCNPGNTRFYRESIGKLRACVAAFNGMPLDGVLQLGDLVDRNMESFTPVLAEFSGLKAPLHHALGNHDFPGGYRNAAEIYARLDAKRGYGDFSHGAWRFIVLDGNDASFRTHERDTPEWVEAKGLYDACKAAGRVNAQDWNGGMGEKQLAWLRTVLGDAKAAGQRAVAFSHFPVWPENAHNLWNDTAVIPILEEAGCVAAYINGHNHAGNYAERNGIHYVTLKGMVETADTTAYAIAALFPDRIEIRGVGRETSRMLAGMQA